MNLHILKVSLSFSRGQFGQKSGLSQTCVNHEGPSEAGSKAKRRKPNNSRVEEASPAAGDWVNPRNNAALPRDAGKRRVRAEGQQCGHWFTGQDGKKVMFEVYIFNFFESLLFFI